MPSHQRPAGHWRLAATFDDRTASGFGTASDRDLSRFLIRLLLRAILEQISP
jgi:hypothetical protein